MTSSAETAIASAARVASVPGTRVLLVSELFPPAVGGSAVLFHGVYSRLDAEVSVLTDGPPGGAGEFERQGGLRVFRMPLATRRWGILDLAGLRHHLRVAARVRRLMPRGAGVVHCGRALPEGLAAWLARMAGGAPYVCWAHGEDLVTASSSRELAALTSLVFRGAAAALANSRNTAALLARLGVADDKIHVVYPAVDAERFHPRVDGEHVRRRYADRDQILLLSVGRLQRRKGHDVAIEAVAALENEIPGLRYVIAGDGEERQRLVSLVEKHGVGDRVFFAGIVPDAELNAYYAACDIFLLPNRIDDDGDIEGFGIVFLEAAASGKPAIGGDSGGVPEAVERDVTGLLVDGSVAQVVSALRDLATSAPRRRGLGLAGRMRADGRFSWQRAAAAVSAVQTRLTAR